MVVVLSQNKIWTLVQNWCYKTGLHAAVGRRGELCDLVVKFLIGPVLCDVVQVAVEVHQQRVIAGLQHLTGDRPSLLPLSQHDPEHSEGE